MQFAQVVGQDGIKSDLTNMVGAQRVPHAMMLLGREGWGMLPLALAYTQYLMCEEKSNTDSCGRCTNCRQIAKLEHPDVRISFPAIPSKPGAKNLSDAYISEFREFVHQSPYGSTFDWLQYINVENKQGNISADECRHIVESMNLKSYQGGYKVHIIWRPEYLEKEGNRLLKLIEEPPPHTVLIFVGEDEKKILPTLLSRLQTIKLKPIPTDVIAKSLSERNQINYSKALEVANIADGSYSEALSALNHWENEMLPIVTAMLNAVYTNNGLSINEWVEDTAKLGREPLKNLFQYMQQLFGAGFRKTLNSNFPLHLSETDTNFVNKLAQLNLSLEAFQYIEQGIGKASYHIGRNANVKVQLLHFCIQMQYWIKGRVLTV